VLFPIFSPIINKHIKKNSRKLVFEMGQKCLVDEEKMKLSE
jgi:hypothetical protein